ncbi:MAG: gamma-glutamyltransferase [Gemmatimonadota bacterium]|nr:gamma-glutamyltransferase [Gemmatimonadota bacterium]
MTAVAVVSISPIAAEAGARVADRGGNAADAAVAATLVSAISAPGMCSLGGAGFALVAPPDGDPEAIDGGFEMPGRGLPRGDLGGGRIDAHLEYAGGVDTTVGPGSVATPGAPALCGLVAERHGLLDWADLVEPAIEVASRGFPLPPAARDYLVFAHEEIFGWNEDSHAALHDRSGRLLAAGATVRIAHLETSLRLIAKEGPGVFYDGSLGAAIADYVRGEGGALGRADLAAYRPTVRPPMRTTHGAWDVLTNPAPAVGGVVLAAMLGLLDGRAPSGGRWTESWAARLATAQAAVLEFRRTELDAADELELAAARLLRAVESGTLRLVDAPSTVHTSAVDSDGLACAITLSDGYGSGAMAPGTGIWLNNALGEPELNPHGFHGWPVGHRLVSNMAPTVARQRGGPVLAIGSPGADRITTALVQVLTNHLDFGMTLQAAVDHPRLHVELVGGDRRVALEPGLPSEALPFPTRPFDAASMFFGGVAAVSHDPTVGFRTGIDARRGCGAAIGGAPSDVS